MKYTEKKIASFQLENQRWQLIEMTSYYDNFQKLLSKLTNEMPVSHYQIRKNRKVIANIKWEGDAKHKFANLITEELNQLNLFR